MYSIPFLYVVDFFGSFFFENTIQEEDRRQKILMISCITHFLHFTLL